MSQITPAFARSSFDAYKTTGSVPGLTSQQQLNPAEVQDDRQRMTDEFQRWQSLDETPADLEPGKPGIVKIAGFQNSGCTEAIFSGTAQNGQLEVFDNQPDMMYGFQHANLYRFAPDATEKVSISKSVYSGTELGPSLTHVDTHGPTGYVLTR